MDQAWGWAGSVEDFLATPYGEWSDALAVHYLSLLGQHPSGFTTEAWQEEHEALHKALTRCVESSSEARRWSLVFEYELPLEGGRRPDVVLMTGGSLYVLEFKSGREVTPADVDQVRAYRRDLEEYHEASRGRRLAAAVVLPRAEAGFDLSVNEVAVTGWESLAARLLGHASEGRIKLDPWLRSRYVPLPTLVTAARRLFNKEQQPHVWRAVSEGIPETVDFLKQLAKDAEAEGRRKIAFVTGVPGAGKTLVGLRLAYEHIGEGQALFLSGNGPLVKVLQDALGSKAVVRDLHKFVQHVRRGRGTKLNVGVFDEAQRLWSEAYMIHKRKGDRSEPAYLVEAGMHMSGWCLLVCLVGEGQTIFTGEEAGMPAWRDAIRQAGPQDWDIYASANLEPELAGLRLEIDERLLLDVSLRMRRADLIHEWVGFVLDGALDLARRRAEPFKSDGFEMYVTRDFQHAKRYCLERYADSPDARYGFIAYSKAKAPRRYGVDNYFGTGQKALAKQGIGRWFNAPPDDLASCCSFRLPATEFHIQGLELDMPVVCWGEEMLWANGRWDLKPGRYQYPLPPARDLLVDSYRVLLTRGRDGLIVWLPPEPAFDGVEVALRRAGLEVLTEQVVGPRAQAV